MTDLGLVLLAAATTGVAVAGIVGIVVRPTSRLAPRLRPYSIASRVGLGGVPDALEGLTPPRGLLRPVVEGTADRLGRLIDAEGDATLMLKLRQAGLLDALESTERVAEYRMRQLGNAVAFTIGTMAVALLLDLEPVLVLGFAAAGFVIGVTRWRGRLDRAIEERRRHMQIEIYTVNQLLALQVRAGAGVIHSVQRLVERGRGAVVNELAEALRAHRSGMAAAEAFRHIGRQTPEPHCRRTYALLATAEERGADLADALLALSEDVRESRRQEIQRRATRQRAGMLFPVIAILAPVMLLFVAAPLPQIIFGIR